MKTLLVFSATVLFSVQANAQQFGLLTSADFKLEGSVLEVKETHFGASEKIKNKVHIQFYMDGRVAEMSEDKTRYGKVSYAYVYDESDKLLKIEELGDSDLPNKITTYTYDGKRIAEIDDQYVAKQFSYAKKGRIAEIVYVNSSTNKEVGKEVFTHSKNGYTTEKSINLIVPVNEVSVYEGANLVTLRRDTGQSEENKYDEHGNLVRRKVGEGDANYFDEFVITYVYDTYGNWIERIEKVMIGTEAYPSSHVKREITYANGEVTGTAK